MASVVTDRKSLPDNALPIADQIEAMGFKWSFNYQYPLPEPEKVQRLQVRDTERAPKQEVDKYAAAMKRGDVFPPGVVTRDDRFVDFNTRAAAAWKTGRRDFPVFILNVSLADATETERDRLYILGGAFNTHGPKPLSRNELVNLVRKITGPDWSAEKVAAHLGVTKNRVANVLAQRRAEQRAARLGVKLNGSLTPSALTILGQRDEKLNDRPFAEILRLAQDAGLTSGELSSLCSRVQEVTGSDDERVALVEEERRAREAQIANYRATAKRKPPMSSEVLKRTRYVENLGSTGVTELVDYNPGTSASYLASVERALAVLTALATAQREANERMAAA